MKAFIPIVSLAFTFIVAAPEILLAQQPEYLPQVGDDDVIYTKRWKAEDFEKANQIVADGHGEAMKESGQTRRTFWVIDPYSYETVAVSFFKKGDSVEAWQTSEVRRLVLEKLNPLMREPMVVRRYRVRGVHNTK